MAKEFKISEQRREELIEERQYLSTVRDKEVTEMIKEARSFGDLSENSEYDEARNEQARLYGRIAEIDNILNHAIIIEESDDFSGHIGLGCRVTVRDLETGDEESYQVVGSQEADPMNGKISDDSPIGKAALKKKVGDFFEVETPGGTMRLEVLEISRKNK